MVSLDTLKPAKGSTKKRKRVGRGNASGQGTTAGRGHKGHKSRTGNHLPYVGFEGGQNPLYKRTPKLKGFFNFNKKDLAVVNISDLANKYVAGETVNLVTLKEKKLIKKSQTDFKLLGTGDIKIALTIETENISATAREKVEKAGGKINSKVQ